MSKRLVVAPASLMKEAFCMPMSVRSTGTCVCVAAILLYASAIGAQQAEQRGGTVSGTVTPAGENPITVHLRASDVNPLRYYDGYEQTADATGHFRFVDVEAGSYTLEAESATARSATPQAITVQPEKESSGLVLALTPKPVLCGHVTENGQSRKSILWFYHYDPERGTLIEHLVPNETEANGTFRITDVPPGNSYLKAYQTWFPTSYSFNGAAPIDSTTASASCIYDIAYTYSGCMTHTVSGQITHVPEVAGRKYHVVFLEKNGQSRIPTTIDFMDKPEHEGGESFSAKVCQGEYELVLSGEQLGNWVNGPEEKIVFDSQSLSVGEADVSGIQLTPHPLASVSGEVAFEGIKREAACPGRGGQSVNILRKEDGEFQSVTLDPTGHFRFNNVSPGTYTLTLGPYSREAVYISRFTADSEPVPGREFTIAAAKAISLQIVLSGNASDAMGHVSTDLRSTARWEADWTRPKGVVAGRIDGQAAGDSTVVLQALRFNSNASGEYRTIPALDGAFQFPAVDPGVYTLRVEGKTIVTTEYGAKAPDERGTPVILNRGVHLEGMNLAPKKLSAVCGRVIDSSGVPLPTIRILPERSNRGNVSQEPQGYPAPPDVRTDAEGRFRYDGLQPGNVFLVTPLTYPAPLFFSKSGGLADAEPLHLTAGEDIGCGNGASLQLQVPANYKVRYSVTGRVIGDIPAQEGDRFWLSLIEPGKNGASRYIDTAKVETDHSFQFSRIPAGEFLLQLFSAYGPEPMMWSGPYPPVSHKLESQPLHVSSDVDDVVVYPKHLATVTGTVTFAHIPEAWKKNFDVTRQPIQLRPSGWGRPHGATLDTDGNFKIEAVDEGEYRVEVDIRAPLYARSVRVNGHEVQGRSLHISHAETARIDVEMSDDAGRVRATVLEEPGLPRPEPSVGELCSTGVYPSYSLFLVPEAWLARSHSVADTDNNDSQPVLRANGGGSQGITLGLAPPGQYRAVILQNANRFSSFFPEEETPKIRAWWRDLADAGLRVTVAPGGTVELVVPDRTVFAARLAARLGLSLREDPLRTATVH
jgi:hypothetical protein